MRKHYVASLLALSSIFLSQCKSGDNAPKEEAKDSKSIELKEVKTGDEALKRLQEGNERFINHKSIFPDLSAEHLNKLREGQHPFVTIVGCSDSRVPIELAFDQGFGDVFVVRTAGNSLDDDMTMGSLEYGAEHLHTPLIVVMGHEKCGGITAAIQEPEKGKEGKEPVELSHLLKSLQNGVKQHVGHPENLDKAIHDNVQHQIEKINQNPELKKLIAENKLKVVGAYYSLADGKITFL